jgi:hypothetical protein
VGRLRPAELALILDRVKKTHPSEAEMLQAHVDSASAEDQVMQLVREMVEAKQQSIAAEARTEATLQAWKPVMEAVAAAISKIASEEKRRNDIEERKITMSRETRGSIMDRVVVPLISAIAGAITAAAGFYFAH